MSTIHILLSAALLSACTLADSADDNAQLALDAVTAKRSTPLQPIIDSDQGPPRVWIEPLDRTTAFDGTIRVGLRAPSATRARMVADLATRTRIATWPELTTVPSQSSVDVIANEDIADATIVLRPAADLAPRWYAVVVDVAHAERPDPTLPVVAPGRVVSRFRVGSEPQVRQAQVCDADGAAELVVEYSEPVDARAAVALDAHGASLCTGAAIDDTAAKDIAITKRRIHRRACAKPLLRATAAAIRVDGTRLVRSDAIAMPGCHVFVAQ